ncbi:hypothetical protein HYV58_02090 [Candidatus Peregrinibacteria bacterium]|nr:hypothetical protein [Candidatus Peregrinibacteria bacterium]
MSNPLKPSEGDNQEPRLADYGAYIAELQKCGIKPQEAMDDLQSQGGLVERVENGRKRKDANKIRQAELERKKDKERETYQMFSENIGDMRLAVRYDLRIYDSPEYPHARADYLLTQPGVKPSIFTKAEILQMAKEGRIAVHSEDRVKGAAHIFTMLYVVTKDRKLISVRNISRTEKTLTLEAVSESSEDDSEE